MSSVAFMQEYVIKAPEFRGAALALGSCRDMEVMLDGPAGTGKTFAALYKIHILLLTYPGAKALVVRKSNTALSGTAMATFRNSVLDEHEGVRYFGGNKVRPAAFEYPNGSLLIVSGLDRPEKVKSLEIDLCFVNEATEITIEDLEFVRSRLRNGKTPYSQIIMDVNPVEPTHWLNLRANEGTTTRLVSTHEDNPRFYNIKTKEWTTEGKQYIFGTLGGLTGVRLARLRYGVWSAASGTVYEEAWSRAKNVIDRYTLPKPYMRFLAIDFGYTNPFCCLWCAIDPDDRIIVYRQLYKTRTLVEEHARQIAIASGWFHLLPKDHKRYNPRPAEWADPLPREIICDHDAEGRATLEAHLGLYTTPAKKAIIEGIQAVTARLLPAGDGKPRFLVMRDSLVERDEELAKAKLPTCLEEEAEMYAWDTRQGAKKGEMPLDAHNHAWDAARYMVNFKDLQPNSVSYFKGGIWK